MSKHPIHEKSRNHKGFFLFREGASQITKEDIQMLNEWPGPLSNSKAPQGSEQRWPELE